MSEQRSDQFVVVKSWHVLILVLTLIVGAAVSYARLQDQSADNSRRVEELERKAMTEPSFQNYQRAIEQRLDRIERKLDVAEAKRH